MHTIIIAEAGVNHNGDINLAMRMVDAAADSGADYVKFQTFKASKLVSSIASKAEYQKKNSKDKSESQMEMLKKLELTDKDHVTLINYCKERNIKFLSAPFDLDSIDFLSKLGLRLFKIPSGEITNLPYLHKISELADSVILSTGMCTLSEITDAIIALKSKSNPEISILHCNTEYPTPFCDVNLKAMVSLRNEFDLNVGYSDHTIGIEVPIAAVALGANIIEKHFTLDKKMEGPDHAASIEPYELKAMVASIRNIEQALGSSIKAPSNSEIQNIHIARRSIHLNVSKHEGDIIQENDLIMLRPGDGISPMKIESIIGKRANKSLEKGHKLSFNDIIIS